MIKRQTLIILTLLCMMALFATAASANDVEDATIGIGDGSGYVIMPIVVTNSTNVGTVDVTLRYDPSIVIVTNVADGDLNVTSSDLKNAGDGRVRISAFTVGDNILGSTFVIANVSFEPVGSSGSCLLEISVTEFVEGIPKGMAMPYTVRNGTYTISYVTPSSRSNREGTYPPIPDDDGGSQDENVTEEKPTVNETAVETPTAPPLKKLPGIDTDDEDDDGISWLWILIVLAVVVIIVGAYLLPKKKNDDEDTGE